MKSGSASSSGSSSCCQTETGGRNGGGGEGGGASSSSSLSFVLAVSTVAGLGVDAVRATGGEDCIEIGCYVSLA